MNRKVKKVKEFFLGWPLPCFPFLTSRLRGTFFCGLRGLAGNGHLFAYHKEMNRKVKKVEEFFLGWSLPYFPFLTSRLRGTFFLRVARTYGVWARVRALCKSRQS
jgi:hypothetical protein